MYIFVFLGAVPPPGWCDPLTDTSMSASQEHVRENVMCSTVVKAPGGIVESAEIEESEEMQLS